MTFKGLIPEANVGIGGDTIEARRHGPPQILGPGGTLEHASSDFGSVV